MDKRENCGAEFTCHVDFSERTVKIASIGRPTDKRARDTLLDLTPGKFCKIDEKFDTNNFLSTVAFQYHFRYNFCCLFLVHVSRQKKCDYQRNFKYKKDYTKLITEN